MSCSVCADPAQQSFGGVLLWERNGEISAICTYCWLNFSLATDNERTIKCDAQRIAFKENIGVESQLYHKVMSQDKLFSENLQWAFNKLKIKKFQLNPTIRQSNELD